MSERRYEYRDDVLDLRAGAHLARHLEQMGESGWGFVTWIPSESIEGGIVVVMRRPR